MHGRMKVRTSEEQAEAKRKEREKEVAAYRQSMAAIFEQRTSGSADKETLKLTEQVLVGNPDISTLWAIRREIIATLTQSCSSEEVTKLYSSELLLMERCLRINPKSYCVWLHRRWTMEHAPSPQWEREKKLCDLFLQYDERNFHCWDYRRYVVKMSGLSPSDEFQFTEEKIAANFSNYSAWHYRSKLLPLIHPSQDSEGVAEDALKNEHELVQNAFYTDPSDQSAWFYHRWLLGKANRPLCIGCVRFTQGPPSTLMVSFNKPFMPSDEEPLVVTMGESTAVTVNQSDCPESQWVVTLPPSPPGDKLRIAVKCGTAQTEMWIEPGQQDHCGVWNIDELLRLNRMSASMTVLTSELRMCQELLEIEPDNKWCLLSCLELMQSVDPLQYHDNIMTTFDKLLKIDAYRNGYYRDLRSRFLISCALRHSLTESNRDLDLSGKGLSRLYYTEHMMSYQHVLLSNNSLSMLPGLAHLKAVQHLCLDNNHLDQVPEQIASLTTLRSLSLKHNAMNTVQDLRGLKGSCLVELELLGNPVCECSDVRQELKAFLPNLATLDGKLI